MSHTIFLNIYFITFSVLYCIASAIRYKNVKVLLKSAIHWLLVIADVNGTCNRFYEKKYPPRNKITIFTRYTVW